MQSLIIGEVRRSSLLSPTWDNSKGLLGLQSYMWSQLRLPLSLWQFTFSLYSIQLFASPFHSCWSQGHSSINVLHAKLSLEVWFPGSPPCNRGQYLPGVLHLSLSILRELCLRCYHLFFIVYEKTKMELNLPKVHNDSAAELRFKPVNKWLKRACFLHSNTLPPTQNQ